ncbi:Uncharacterised protein [Mycobacteroides abscessus]|nr:Uncharacterised protein [Mycobacteroides abscessus]
MSPASFTRAERSGYPGYAATMRSRCPGPPRASIPSSADSDSGIIFKTLVNNLASSALCPTISGTRCASPCSIASMGWRGK